MNFLIKERLQALWIIIPVVLLTVIYQSTTLDPDIYIRLTGLAIYLIALTLYMIVNRKKIQILPDTVLLSIYLLFVVYTLLSIFATRNSADGIFEWIKILYGFLLFLLLSALMKKTKPEQLVARSFTALCFVLSLSGIYEIIKIISEGKLIIPQSTYEIVSFYGHRNMYCQMLFFSFPFALMSAFYSKEKSWKIIGQIAFSLGLFLLVILSNRATWLALAGGFLSLLFFYLLHNSKNIPLSSNPIAISKKNGAIAGIIIALGAILFVYGNYSDISSLETHTKDIVHFDKGSTKDRIELWQRTIEMIKEKPLLGHGLGDWKIEILKYGNEGLVSEDNNTFYQRPHNDFLWMMSEYGLIGTLLFMGIWIVAITYLIRIILLKCKSREEFFFYNMLLMVMIGFFVYSFFSFPRERAETLVVTAIVLGLTMNKHRKFSGKQTVNQSERIPSEKHTGIFLILILVLVPASLYIIRSRFVSDVHMKNALQAKNQKDNALVIREINKAISPFYPTDPFSTPLTWYRGSAYFNLNNTDLALKDFEEARKINPYHIHVLNNLASAYERTGEHGKSIEFYKKALAIAPNFEEAALNLCAVYFNTGQTDSAYMTLSDISTSTNNPSYPQFLRVVIESQFQDIVKKEPTLEKWKNLVDKDPGNYLKIHQYSRIKKDKIIRIFTDTLLLRSICSP